MRTGWFRDAPRGEDDLCPNCVTPWKCNGPHLDEYQVIKLRSSALAAIRRAAEVARECDKHKQWAAASAARDAIRAAIGSPKV